MALAVNPPDIVSASQQGDLCARDLALTVSADASTSAFLKIKPVKIRKLSNLWQNRQKFRRDRHPDCRFRWAGEAHTCRRDEALAHRTLYANIMQEIKIRIAAVDAETMNQLPVVPPLVKEFCYLQFRMICEPIAVGCLVAHGDNSGAKQGFRKHGRQTKSSNCLRPLTLTFSPFQSFRAKMMLGTTR